MLNSGSFYTGVHMLGNLRTFDKLTQSAQLVYKGSLELLQVSMYQFGVLLNPSFILTLEKVPQEVFFMTVGYTIHETLANEIKTN